MFSKVSAGRSSHTELGVLQPPLQMEIALERMSGEASRSDDWELDPAEIDFQEKIASGAFGDLYKGSYCGQEVAIKILRNVQDDTQQYQEFLQVRPWQCRNGAFATCCLILAPGTGGSLIDADLTGGAGDAGSQHHAKSATQKRGAVHRGLHAPAESLHRFRVHALRKHV